MGRCPAAKQRIYDLHPLLLCLGAGPHLYGCCVRATGALLIPACSRRNSLCRSLGVLCRLRVGFSALGATLLGIALFPRSGVYILFQHFILYVRHLHEAIFNSQLLSLFNINECILPSLPCSSRPAAFSTSSACYPESPAAYMTFVNCVALGCGTAATSPPWSVQVSTRTPRAAPMEAPPPPSPPPPPCPPHQTPPPRRR